MLIKYELPEDYQNKEIRELLVDELTEAGFDVTTSHEKIFFEIKEFNKLDRNNHFLIGILVGQIVTGRLIG